MSHELLTLLCWNHLKSMRPSPTTVGDECPTAPVHAVRAPANLLKK